MKIDVFKVTEAELNIMQILWDKEAVISTDELVCAYAKRYGNIKPRAVRKLAANLMAKGLLTYVQSGGRNFYLPVWRKEKYQAFAAMQFLKVLFNGSVTEMVFAMLKESGIDQDDWKALMEMAEMVEIPNNEACSATKKSARAVYVFIIDNKERTAFFGIKHPIYVKRQRTGCIPRAA